MNMHTTKDLSPHGSAGDAFARNLETWRTRRQTYDALPLDDVDRETESAASDALTSAENELFDTPAQTISDFRAKFEVAFPDTCSSISDVALKGLFNDLKRLDENAPSRTFDAQKWLSLFERRGGGWVEREGEIVLLVPEGARLDYPLWELDTRGARQAVYDLIRKRGTSSDDQTDFSTFQDAVAAYRDARDDYERKCREGDDEAGRAACTASDKAFERMLKVPAANVADIATKLETMIFEYQDSTLDEDRARLIADDARRLSNADERWSSLVARFQAVQARMGGTDDDIDEAGELIGKIMAFPAPDGAALKWKLDWLLDTEPNGFTGSYAASYVEQTKADYRRILSLGRDDNPGFCRQRGNGVPTN